MRRSSILFSAFLALSPLYYSCHSNIELETRSNILAAIPTENKEDNIIRYQGRVFYSGGIDETLTQDITKSQSDAGYLLSRTFYIHVEAEGDYYLNTHVMPALNGEEESFQEIRVLVNDSYAGWLDIQADAWSFVPLENRKTIHLKPGSNKITYSSLPPYYPEIDVIQVEPDQSLLMKEDSQFLVFIDQLRRQNNSSTKKLSQLDIEREVVSLSSEPATKSAYDDSYNWQVTPRTLSNPDGNYQHTVCVPVTYTYHRRLSLSNGTYTFMTGPIDGNDFYTVDPVMYLYKIDDPHNYSYYNDDYSGRGFHSQITATLPAGDYYLVIRAYSSYYASTTTGRQGLVNVYQNGAILNSQCPIAGYSVDVDSPNTGIINYFTAYSTGIPVFFLEEKSSNKVKFIGETFFYVPPMEQMWFDDARVRLTKSSSSARYKMIVSCVGAFGAYYGNCDVYGSCQQVMTGDPVADSFPNLMVNDGIYSSAANTDRYNCASWAGGVTYGWTWGGIYASHYNGNLVGPNYGDPHVWSSWDAYFANNPQRYAGATVYTREGANANNGEIAVWSKSGDISDVTHFSCRGTANEHPHGYAWESKPGQHRRFFHPRDALVDTNPDNPNRYGSIIAYYRNASKPEHPSEKGQFETSLSFEESIRRGLTVIENVELSADEAELHAKKLNGVSKSVFSEIENMYDIWAKTVTSNYQSVSNPYTLIFIPEGVTLIDYCRKWQSEALAFFCNLFFDKNEPKAKAVSYYLFCVIFSDYAEKIEMIKDSWKENPYDKNGAYVAPLPEMFVKKYAKSLIKQL